MATEVYAENRKIRFEYDILKTYEAGISLFGPEVKGIKTGKCTLAGSLVKIANNEAYLLNADIPPYQPENAPKEYDPKRTRKLLMNYGEIKELIGKTQEKGLTIVPISMYNKNHLIKVEIALVKKRKKSDKREALRKKETRREIKKVLG